MADSGYSWVVLFAAFMLNLHHAGGVGSIGVFLLEFMDHFDVPKSATTPIAGLLLCVGFIFGFPVGWLCRAYGCRVVALMAGLLTSGSLVLSSLATSITTLYFTYGCLASIALCTLFTAGTIAIQQHFEKRRAFANGIAIAGVSVGVFVWPPFSRWVCDMFGWRGALVLLGGIHLHSLIFAMLLRPAVYHPRGNVRKPQQVPFKEFPIESQHLQVTTSGPLRTFKNQFRLMTSPLRHHPGFIGYLAGVLLIQAGHIIPYGLIPTRAKAMGIDRTLGATLVSIIGLCSGCSRTVCGYIGDRPFIDRAILSGISGTVAGVMTALSVFLTNYIQMAIYAALLGVTSAAYIALQGATVVDLVGLNNTALGIGYLSTVIGLGHLLSLTLSGKLLDHFNDPAYTFLIFGAIEVIGGLIILVTMVTKKCYRKTTDSQPGIEES